MSALPLSAEPKTFIAVLVARPGQRDALAAALTALVPPTRAESGCLDYTLFERVDQPGTFYMRESFRDEAAFAFHIAAPHFLGFQSRLDELVEGPILLEPLKRIA